MKEIIIAEDVYALLRNEQSFLRRSDIRIFPSASNRDILAVHKDRKADLIISNLDEEDMNGEDLCAVIRGDDALRAVSIMLVCSGQEADLTRCVACNANAFISRPISTAVLLQEAHRLLNIAPRKSCRVPLSIKVDGIAHEKAFGGKAENISASGMLLWSAAKLQEGDAMQCSFALSGAKRLTAVAEVVRVLPDKNGKEIGYGISFVDLSPEAAAAIESFAGK
jgi:CheY-like chemotaxis protein